MIQIRYICDRCGDEVDQWSTVSFTIHPRSETRDPSREVYDTICSQCEQSFRDWVDAGSKNS